MKTTLRQRWIAVVAALGMTTAGLVVASGATAAGVQTLAPTADTYVQEDRPTENFGTSVRWSAEGRPFIKRNALLRFNVPAVPAGEKVVSAKLRATSEAVATATETVDVYGTTGTWTEAGATWQNQPARGSLLAKAGNYANGAVVEWDVTSFIGDGGFVNFKMETVAQKWLGFKSKEATSGQPQLVVTTEVVAAPPPAPTGDVNDTAFTYTGAWSSGPCAACYTGDNHYSSDVAGTYSQKVTGNKVEIYSEKNAALGIFAVSIDGGAEVLVDPYSAAGRQDNVLVYASPILTEGEHTVKVRNTGTKNAASTGNWIVADRIKAISGATEPPPPPPPPAGDGTTAAATHNWGPVVRGDEFNYTGAPDVNKWTVYGDYAGHAGNGQRLKAQTTVNGTAARIDGDVSGNTGGMSAKYDEGIAKYYRLESRMRTSERTPRYHPVMLQWADAVDGGQVITAAPEIDYAEGTADTSKINFYLHWQGSATTTSASKVLDTREWHNYAVEWTDKAVIGYIDGVEWFRDTDPAHIPNTPMHSTIQLDWFPEDSATAAPAWMEVDWTREYNVATTPPPPPPAGGSWDVAAVGDMNGEKTSSPDSASGKNASSIIAKLNSGALDNFIAIGDIQYSKGSCSSSSVSYYGYWNGLWGGAKGKTYWTAGPNHDVEWSGSTTVNDDLGKYMDGACVSTTKSATSTDPTRKGPNAGAQQSAREWYSFDKGNWHVLSAPSAAWRYDATRARAMTAEMDADLAAAKAAGKHLMVLLHEPYFGSTTSSHGRELAAKPWIDVFYKNRVKVLFSGSQHNYERTCPVNNADQCVADGMQMFQISTGGIGLRAFSNSAPAYSQKRFTGTWGYGEFSFKDDGSYTWNYVPTSGTMTNTDSGSRP